MLSTPLFPRRTPVEVSRSGPSEPDPAAAAGAPAGQRVAPAEPGQSERASADASEPQAGSRQPEGGSQPGGEQGGRLPFESSGEGNG